MPDDKLFEVLTVYTLNGVAGKHIGRHIVVARSAAAASQLPLKENEEVSHIREMSEYELVVMEQ